MNGSFLREFARMVQWTAQAIRLLLVDCKINLYTVILVIIVAQATSLCVFWVLAHYTSTSATVLVPVLVPGTVRLRISKTSTAGILEIKN